MKSASGTSLPIVSALTTDAPWRTPRTLIQPKAMRERDQERRARPADRQRRPVVAERDAVAAMMLAWLVARENHCIQPISKPTKSPNAARVKTYGPPVVSKRLLNSAKQSATDSDENADQHEADRAPRADLRGDLRRPQEDRAADHLVDADRGEVPAPERPLQRDIRRELYHGA